MRTPAEVQADNTLRMIFRRLDEQARGVSFYSGLASDWQSLLAFKPMASLSINDVSDLPELNAFFEVHSQHLITGVVTYDLGRELLGLASRHSTKGQLPLLTFYTYDNYLLARDGEIITTCVDNTWQNYLTERMNTNPGPVPESSLDLTTTVTESSYKEGFDKIQRYIRDGDMYQINYTFPMSATSELRSRDIFAYYLEHKPVAYAAYVETDTADILSLSPEGFYHEKDGLITTRPIKGTRPRGENNEQDDALQAQLMASKKEQAELFMIIDLLRNDLGRVCETASVEVTRSKALTALPNVWHTYGEIQGRRRADISTIEAVLDMLPGGSITGCPKRRAMEIIDELEVQQRGVYTGSLGYRLPDGETAFNIAIRTLVKQQDTISLGVGGGITIKSECTDEYQEALAKSNFFRSTN